MDRKAQTGKWPIFGHRVKPRPDGDPLVLIPSSLPQVVHPILSLTLIFFGEGPWCLRGKKRIGLYPSDTKQILLPKGALQLLLALN